MWNEFGLNNESYLDVIVCIEVILLLVDQVVQIVYREMGQVPHELHQLWILALRFIETFEAAKGIQGKNFKFEKFPHAKYSFMADSLSLFRRHSVMGGNVMLRFK